MRRGCRYYGLYLTVIGLREVHATTTGKAALLVLIPFAVVLVVALIGVAAGIAVLSQR